MENEKIDREVQCKSAFDFLKIWYNKEKEANIYKIKAEESEKDLMDFKRTFLSNEADIEMFRNLFENFHFKSNENEEIILDEIDVVDGVTQFRFHYDLDEISGWKSIDEFFKTFLFTGKFKFYPKE